LWRPEQHGQREAAIDADWNIVTPRYFGTIGTPIVRGRAFAPADSGQSPDVAIVNETLAARVWPGEDPIGRLLTYGEPDRRSLQVVGVARNAKYQTLGEASQPFIYVPLAQHYDPEMSLLLKHAGPSPIPAVRSLLREVNPNLPLSRASTLGEATAFGLAPNRLAAWMASVTGLIGALLAALGMYGVTAHYVSQRRREIGIRMALGGLRAHVIRLVVSQGAVLGSIGMVVGVALAAGASTLLAALLFAVQPLDTVSFGIGVVLSVVVTVGASLVPALGAASVNPVEALRQD
jgi:putative ABC transport system permease protein